MTEDSTPEGPFSRTTVLVMILAGVFAFSAMAVLSAYAPNLRSGSDGGGHALSKSAIGFAGLVALLNAVDQPAVVNRGDLGAADANDLLILTPRAGDEAVDMNDFFFSGPILLVLPKWQAARQPQRPEWVFNLGLVPEREITKPLTDKIIPGTRLVRRKGAAQVRLRTAVDSLDLGDARVASLQSLAESRWKPVVVDETGAVLMVKAPASELYVLSDPDLLNTQGLRDPEGARLALSLIRTVAPADGAVYFDVTLNGHGRNRNLFQLAFEPPFLAMTLCAFAAAVLMGLHAAVRFGAPRRTSRALALGKRALADNQAALIRLAGREHRMGPAYAALVRDHVARAVGAARNLSGDALEAFLDRIGARRSELSIEAMSAEARRIADPPALVRLARRLHQWKLEMIRERQ